MNMHLDTDALISTKLTDSECGKNEGRACRIFWLMALSLESSFKEHVSPVSNNCWWGVGFPIKFLDTYL